MPVAPEYLHLVYPGTEFTAFLYGRNSHDPTGRGRSVADQLHEGRTLCEQYNWPIAGVFDKDIGRSASRHAKKARADFESMLEGIRNKECRIVVAFEASRYYRDLEAYVRLRNACHDADVLLCYNGTVYDLSKRQDRNITAQHALQAEDEAEGISDRQLRTQRRLADQGKPGGRAPYGFKRSYDPDTGELLQQIPHPVRAPYVEEIFDRFTAGQTTYAIAKWLNSEPPARHPGGRPWSIERVTMILKNPAYIAQRVHQGKIVGKARWDGLVEPEVFQAAQRILADPSRTTQRESRIMHLLSYIPLCGEHEEEGIPAASRRTRPTEVPEKDPGIIYPDSRCDMVRAMYLPGWRPVVKQIRRVLQKDHGHVDDGTLRTLREEVERHEPALAALPSEPPPLLKAAKRNGKQYYDCPAAWDTAIRADPFEAYVEEAVIRWLRSPAAAAAFREERDGKKVSAAKARLQGLEQQLDEARAAAVSFGQDGKPKLSVMSLAAMESTLMPQISQARSVIEEMSASVPPLLRHLVGNPDAEGAWGALLPEQKRAALRDIVTIRLHPAHVRGVQKILPGRITLAFVGEPGFRKDG